MLETIGALGLLSIIGVIAFSVTVITQLLKGISFIDRMPTKLLAVVVSMLAAIAYTVMTAVVFSAQAVVFTVSLGFAGAYVAIFGWDTLAEIWDQFNKDDKDKK